MEKLTDTNYRIGKRDWNSCSNITNYGKWFQVKKKKPIDALALDEW
jgi:hypothetical protein